MPLIDTYPAGIYYECGFNATAANTVPAWWTDITSRTTFAHGTSRGRQYELDTNPAGEWRVPLENKDGALDPSNTASPYYPDVVPYKPCRIRVTPGVNLLTADQATCGQGSALPPGTSTAGGNTLYAATGVTNDFGYTLSLQTSGSAYTGTQVYQVTVPAGAVQFATILIIPVVPIVQGRTYTASAQVRITSGSSVSCNVGLVYYDRSGNQLAAGPGSPQTITSGSSTWTTLSCTTQAPGLSTPATYCYLKVYVNATPATNTVIQVGALQLENSASATGFQAPQSLGPNLLPRAIATGLASISLTNDTAANWFYPETGSVAQANYLTAAPSGHTTAVAWTTPAGTTSSPHLYVGGGSGTIASGGAGPIQDTTQVTAGVTYTASVYLTRAVSADTTIQMVASLRWYDINGNLISAPAGSAVTVPTGGTWVRATCTSTAPATAAWARARIYITSPSSTTATNTVYATGWQFEQAAAASTWMDPGPTFYIYTGLFERWPQTWLMNGTYGQVQAIGVDAEAVLAQDTLLAPFVEEVLAMGPNFFYQLNDPAGSSSCVDVSANRLPAPVENSPYGIGSLTFGSSIASTNPSGTFVGTPGPVATFANVATSTGVQQFAETFVSLHKVSANPGPPLTGSWTRLIAFRAASAPGTNKAYTLWSAACASYTNQPSLMQIQLTNLGYLVMQYNDSVGSGGISYTGTTNLCDGNWHLVAIGNNPSGNSVGWVDGVVVSTTTGGAVPAYIATDVLGANAVAGSNWYNAGHIGDLAFAIEFPTLLTNTQMTNLYGSFRSASAGESSGARATRVLTWAGWNGPVAIDSGSTQDMGPASDLTGATALDALNAIALTEAGNLFVSTAGAITLASRARRYNQTNPQFTFGENTGVGEWPYESVSFDFDPQHLFNDVQVTQYSTSQVAEAVGATSEAAYYQRVLQRTINPGLYTEAVDAASYLLQQYSSARLRVADLTLHPSGMLGLFRVCLELEIGTRVRIMRRPPSGPGAAPIQFDGFVESVTWDIDPDSGEVFVHLQCSPADTATYWTLGALHTTLASPVTAGASQASISALPDAALNPLNASLPQSYQLTFDPGTSLQETLTIAPPLPATNPGYSSALLTFTSAFQNNHAAGAVVCEVLPTGYTDPTTWDVGTVLAPLYTTAISTTSSTVTVNPLPDYRTNPGKADWTIGDLVWISPGTARFQGYNLLHPNIATAGEGVLPVAAGTTGTGLGVTGAAGTPTITASGSAFQGAQVWQTAVTASHSTPSGLLFVSKIAATANLPYTASVYMRSVTTGANPSVYVYVEYLSAAGTNLGSTNSSTTTLTGSPTASWTRASVTGTAPAGAVWAQIGVVLTGTAPSIAWSWQGDGLQLEQASSASTYQTCPQVAAAPSSVAGYSSLTLTIANVTPDAAAGDWVCDPLPAGTSSPTAVSGTTRIAY